MKIIALLVVCTLPCACVGWNVTSLEPQQFSAQKSPEIVRLTLNDSTRVTAQHPVLIGDSLVWMQLARGSRRDSVRSAIAISSIRQVQVQKVDEAGTALLLLALGGLVAGIIAFSKAVTME